MERINSIKHEKIVFARSLQQRKGRVEANSFLVEGEKQIEWVKKSPCRLEYVLIHDKMDKPPCFGDIPHYLCTDGVLKKVTGTSYLVPFIGVASLPAQADRGTEEIVVVLDGVQDFGNIGTIVRTAYGFGIHSVASTQPDFDLFQRKTIDASRGAVFQSTCDVYSDPSATVKELKAKGYQIVATALEGSTLQSLAQLEAKPTAIVFGNETNGVSTEVLDAADLKIQIPMATPLDSLNVGVAAGISLYELKYKVILMLLDEKIKGSVGRNLSCTSRWLRKAFDEKLKGSTSLSAEEAILLMVLSCDEEGERNELIAAAGIKDASSVDRMIEAGYFSGDQIVKITDMGKELLAKVWSLHESAENLALEGFNDEEKQQLEAFLLRIQSNLSSFTLYD